MVSVRDMRTCAVDELRVESSNYEFRFWLWLNLQMMGAVPEISRLRKHAEVTVCVLVFGDFPDLARRALDSIIAHCRYGVGRLIVGANAPGQPTLCYLERLQMEGFIDRLIISETNINKCPMMRRMFEDIETKFIWWFDDDSYITEPEALVRWLDRAQSSPESMAAWGQLASCNHPRDFTELADPTAFVRTARWYRGLPPPSWRPGGKGEFNFQGRGTGDGRWFFLTGGCWMIRSSVIKKLDLPDPRLRKMGDDVFLGEAIRQNGWEAGKVSPLGVAINTEVRRGEAGFCRATSLNQV